jgi:hypothetical protein
MVFIKDTHAADVRELLQSSSIVCCLPTQGVALGWNLLTPSALASELWSPAKLRLGLNSDRCFAGHYVLSC